MLGYGQADTKILATFFWQAQPVVNSRRVQRFRRRICWGAVCQCSQLSCEIGAHGTCNGTFLVRITNHERATQLPIHPQRGCCSTWSGQPRAPGRKPTQTTHPKLSQDGSCWQASIIRHESLRFSMTTALCWCAWRRADSQREVNSEAVPFSQAFLGAVFSPAGSPSAEAHVGCLQNDAHHLSQIMRKVPQAIDKSDFPSAPCESRRHWDSTGHVESEVAERVLHPKTPCRGCH